MKFYSNNYLENVSKRYFSDAMIWSIGDVSAIIVYTYDTIPILGVGSVFMNHCICLSKVDARNNA